MSEPGEPAERVSATSLETEASARALIGSLSGRELIALATLARLVAGDVRQDLADHLRVACAVPGHEQHCVADFRARGGRVHGAFMSLPRRSGR